MGQDQYTRAGEMDGLRSIEEEQISKYRKMLHSWSGKVNLISPSDREQILEKHIRPALEMVHILKMVPHSQILDLGSGAGLPGIPIKIYLPQAKVFLVESRRKRASFLKEVIRRLGLKKVEVVNSRIEEWERSKDTKVDLVVSRAVAPIEQIAEWVEPVLKPSGFIVTSMGNRQGGSMPLVYGWSEAERVNIGLWQR